MLARRLPSIPVICGTKRILAGEAAMRQFQCNLLILDDGFQHRYLARDLDVVMLDAQKPFGNGRLLPRGILREGITALSRAEALVLSRFDSGAMAALNLENFIRLYPDKPILTARQCPVRIFAASTLRERPLSSLKEARLAAFAGIGRPDDFFKTVHDLGASLVYATALPDHHPLTTDLLASLVREASGLEPELWLTTEKDWVRLPEDLPGSMDLWVMATELDVGNEDARFKAMVRRSLQATTVAKHE
jgi:tetraacyldisaccharide 4'-kinase